MRILIIADYPPYPPISGDRIRNYSLIRRIARQHETWLAAPILNPSDCEGIAHLREFCKGVEIAELRRHKLARLPGMLRYALAGKPFDLDFLYSEELANKIRHLVSSINFDIIEIEQSRMAPYLEALPPNVTAKRILTFQNVASVQYGRISKIALKPIGKLRAWIYARHMGWWEPRYAERFDRCIAMSEMDRRMLIASNPRLKISVIPNGVDTHLYEPLPLPEMETTLIFIGSMDYSPCADGAIWFCNQVLPRIRRKFVNTEVWIVGR